MLLSSDQVGVAVANFDNLNWNTAGNWICERDMIPAAVDEGMEPPEFGVVDCKMASLFTGKTA